MTEKKIKNSHFRSTHFLENVLSLSISRNSLQTPPLDGILLENFALSNLIILVEDL